MSPWQGCIIDSFHTQLKRPADINDSSNIYECPVAAIIYLQDLRCVFRTVFVSDL